MERYITDSIYEKTLLERSAEVELEQERFYKKLLSIIGKEAYIGLEEELNGIYSKLEKEVFYRGFIEGIRFLIRNI